jgi:para-nitrobenzyl esterase
MQPGRLPRQLDGVVRKRLLGATLFVLVLTTALIQSNCSSGPPAVVPTTHGPVQGAVSGDVIRFLGIPYALPPVGPLRWRLPQPHPGWQKTTRSATAFGPICPQPAGDTTLPPSSEDCLYLNVYAPFPLQTGRKVMVWIHGGTNTNGASSFYDPTPLVTAGGVIVVTLNYRLGALGFLAHPALRIESGSTGNYGLADQQQAMHWVRDNIAAFGGDRNEVTIFGESSGGMNVLSQVVSPLARGLFRRAIVESGAFLLDTPPLAESERQGREFAQTLGCADQSAVCLRSKTADEILARQGSPYGNEVAYELATIDGKILTMSQRDALTGGSFHRGPLLLGNNADEGRLFVPPDLSAADYPKTLEGYAQSNNRPVAGVLQQYPLSKFATPSEGAAAAYGDAYFACPDRLIAGWVGAHVPVYAYEFNDNAGGTAPMGPTHGAELRYLFHVTNLGPLFDGSPSALPAESKPLSLAMRRYWTGFAQRGTPNESGLPVWRTATSGDVQLLVARQPRPGSAKEFEERHKCSYWNGR